MTRMTPILLLEVNEIPWRVIDKYLSNPKYKNLRKFFDSSLQYTTTTSDSGELSPWVTWPTFHRGLINDQHGVQNLGQDPSTFRGTPIWEEIRKRGGTIGVCGSMQSWPPQDPGHNGFYIPDTFAHDKACIPSKLEPFQEFNLGQVRRNTRVVDNEIPKPLKAVNVALSAIRGGVRFKTLGRVARQILAERSDPNLTKRRPIFQTVLFWDVFSEQFRAATPPAFSTFFTNHVAGVMHRYWHDVFPEDFANGRMTPPAPSGQEPLMQFAIQVLDDMLGDVIAWTECNPELIVVFASSMGQEAVAREEHEGVELVVEDLDRLMSAVGVSSAQYSRLLAMAPQVAVDIPDATTREAVAQALAGLVDSDGRHFVRTQTIGTSVSVTVGTPRRSAISHGFCRAGDRKMNWGEIGIRAQEVEAGTGYHIPEGSLAFFGKQLKAEPAQTRPGVRSELVKDWLLRISQQGGAQAALHPRP